jgi:hypothetical protein
MIEESGIVIAGTPAECLAQLDEVLRLAKPYRFDIVDMASPLGAGLERGDRHHMPRDFARARAPFERLWRKLIMEQVPRRR